MRQFTSFNVILPILFVFAFIDKHRDGRNDMSDLCYFDDFCSFFRLGKINKHQKGTFKCLPPEIRSKASRLICMFKRKNIPQFIAHQMAQSFAEFILVQTSRLTQNEHLYIFAKYIYIYYIFIPEMHNSGYE